MTSNEDCVLVSQLALEPCTARIHFIHITGAAAHIARIMS